MNIKQYLAAGFLGTTLVLTGSQGVIAQATPETTTTNNPVQTVERKPVSAYDSLTHQQQVWVNALEWCESKGDHTAINPNDVDNTPSYYSFQFKPSTFKYYGEKYGIIQLGLSSSVISEKMKDHDLQQEIVANMLNDKSVNMRQQFPVCVRTLGLPVRFTNDSLAKKASSTGEVSLAKTKTTI